MANNEEDFTTDACPSPPRGEEKNWERVRVPNAKDDDDFEEPKPETEEFEEVKQEIPKFSTKKPSKTKSKKASSPKVFTNVINITNGNGIHIGTNVNFFMNKGEEVAGQTPRKTKDVEMTINIKKLFVCQNPVSDRDILYVSGHMDHNWRDTARYLDYSDGQITQFHEDYKNISMKEVIYQFLLDWIRNNLEKATVEKLATALWETNQKEVVDRWSQKYSFSNKN